MPGARAFRSTVQSIPNGAWTDLVYSGTRWNDEAMWAAGSPSRLTATAAGLHIVTASLALADSGVGARLFRILSNAARWEALAGHAPGGSVETSAGLATLVNAAIGDYFTAGLYQSSGGALNTGVAGAPYSAELTLARLASGVGARRESSVAQSIPAGVWTTLAYNTTAFAVGMAASGNALVAPSDGTYAIFAGAYLPAASGAVAAQDMAILIDGGYYGLSGPGTSTTSVAGWSVSTTFLLVAGQSVTAAIYQATGAARLTDVAFLRPYLAMARIGP